MKLSPKRLLLFLILASTFFQLVQAQSVLDPNDPTVTHTYGTPKPPLPANANVINKWLYGTRRKLGWNTNSYKSYIYKHQTFRLKYPRTYNPTANDGKRYPMLIFFHGLGELGAAAGNDMIWYENEYHLLHGGQRFRDWVDNGTYDGYIMFMQVQLYGWDAANYVALKEIADYMVVNNKLDPFAITDNGLSGGAFATWAMMTDYPQLISGSLPMSGAGVGIIPEIPKIRFTPIWLFQGGGDQTQDEQLSLQVKAAIDNAGGRLTYSFIPGAGHNTWDWAFTRTDFMPFIKRAYAANPWPLYGKTNYINNEPIATTIGVAPGFDSYEWRRNGTVIPGATANTIFTTQPGKYEVRLTEAGVVSEWSRIPVNIFLNGALLPVSWKSFSGNLVAGGIGLNWEVENNEQAKSYQIEHSTDGKNYVRVDELANKPDVKAYKYNYKTTEAGKHYFRILQTDADGKFVYSKVVVINIKGDGNYTIRLITNPVRVDYADLEINALKQGRALIEIWSASGARISSKQQLVAAGNTRLQVPLNGASAGLYLIKVQIGNTIVSEKLMKF